METNAFYSYQNLNDASRKIRAWLSNFKSPSNKHGACIFIGNIGLGKTSLIRSLTSLDKYDPLFLTPGLMPAKTHLKSFVHDNILSLQMENALQGVRKRRVIIVDEIDTLSYKQKTCLLYFLSWIYPSKRKNRRCLAIENDIPFIFIGRHTHIKAMQTVLKHCLQLTLAPPSVDEQFAMVKTYCRTNQVVVVNKAIHMLLDFCNSDLRSLKLMSKELIQSYSKRVTVTAMRHFLQQYGKVSLNVGVSWSTLYVINGDIDFEHAYPIYQQDKYLLPLMIHENYPLLYRDNVYDKNETIWSLINILTMFDQYDTHMYRHQFWSLQELCGLLICGGASSVIHDAQDEHVTPFEIADIRFTRHLNRTSLITVRKRKLYNLMEKTEIYDINGLFYLKQLLYSGKKINPEIQRRFGLTDKECDHILKLDILSPTITSSA